MKYQLLLKVRAVGVSGVIGHSAEGAGLPSSATPPPCWENVMLPSYRAACYIWSSVFQSNSLQCSSTVNSSTVPVGFFFVCHIPWNASDFSSALSTSFLNICVFYVYGCSAYLYVCAPHIPGAAGGQKRVLVPLGLELQVVVSCCVLLGIKLRSLEEQPTLSCWAISTDCYQCYFLIF